MAPVIYDVILHNFNKVVKEKYGDKPVKVSELPWRDWWRECGARPVGQNNVAGSLVLRSDMFEETITYDEYPFLDNADGVTEFIIECNGRQNIEALPPMKNAKRLEFYFTGSRKQYNMKRLSLFINSCTKQPQRKYVEINGVDAFGDFCLCDDFFGLVVFTDLEKYPNIIKAVNANIWLAASNNFFNEFNMEIECQTVIADGVLLFATKNSKDFFCKTKAKEFRLENVVIVANGLEDIFQDLNNQQTIAIYYPIVGCNVEKMCLNTVATFDLKCFHTEYDLSLELKEEINRAIKTYGVNFSINNKNNIADALQLRETNRICGGF